MLAACGGSGGDSKAERAEVPEPEKTTTTTAPKNEKVFTAEELAPKLLQLADMPTGWSTDQTVDPAGDVANQTDGSCNGPNALARSQTAGSPAYVTAYYSGSPTTGPLLGSTIYAFPTTAAATAFLTATQQQVSSCTTWTASGMNTSTGTAEESISALSYPKVGDETLALRKVTAGQDAGTIAFAQDVVSVRYGNVVATVQLGGLSTDPTQLEQFVAKQAANLASLGA